MMRALRPVHIALAAAVVATPAAGQEIAYGADAWRYGTGPLSDYAFRNGVGPGSRYWLHNSTEPGSLHFLINGTGILSAYWWLNSTEPGSAYYWRNGTAAGSEWYWRNGRGCLSEFGWRNGAGCNALSARFLLVLCFAEAIEVEACPPARATLEDWAERADAWPTVGRPTTTRIGEMRAAIR